jgi:molecular chaperone DnaK (HSP70)
MNVDECVAVGCGIVANSLLAESPFRVKDLLTSDLTVQIGNNALEVFFPRGTHVPTCRTATMPITDTPIIRALSDGKTVASCQVEHGPPVGGVIPDVSFTVHVDLSMVVEITIAETASGDFRSLTALSESEIERFRGLECRMAAVDADAERIDWMKNELDRLNIGLKQAMKVFHTDFTQEELDGHRELVRQNRQWLKSEGPFAAGDLLQRQGKIQSILEQTRVFKEIQDECGMLIALADNYLSRYHLIPDAAVRSECPCGLHWAVRELTAILGMPKGQTVKPRVDAIRRQVEEIGKKIPSRRK